MRVKPKASLNPVVLRRPLPVTTMLEVTNRCNEKCVHCLRDSPFETRRADPLSTEDWKRVIDGVARAEGFAVVFTGGECTLRADLIELIRHARAHGLAVSIKTNGLRLSERYVEALYAAGVRRMEISVYGATPETHDRTTLVPGSFEATLAGALRAMRRGIRVTLNYCVMRSNVGELLVMKEWAERHGFNMQRDYFLIRSDNGRTFRKEFATMEQIRWIETVWPGNPLACNEEEASGSKKVSKCIMGIGTAAVTHTGDVLPCIQVRASVGNVLERPFDEIWRDDAALAPFRGLDPGRHEKCNGCSHVASCRVCPGQHLTYTGSMFEPPEERCRITFGKDPTRPARVPPWMGDHEAVVPAA